MYFKIFFHFILALLVSLIQLTLIQPLFSWFGYFNLVLVALLFVLSLSGFNKAIIWAFVVGFVYGVYGFFPSPVFIIYFLLALIIVDFLLRNFFTDRSLYSFLALTLILVFIFNLFFYATLYIWHWYSLDLTFFLLSKGFWINFLKGMIYNFGLVFICFYFFNFISNRLSAVFLKH